MQFTKSSSCERDVRMPMSAAMEILQEHMPTHNTVGKKKARTLCSAPKPPKEDGGDVQPGHSDLA